MSCDDISLSIHVERDKARNDEPSEMDLVVQVSARKSIRDPERQAHLNLCLVIDKSGSMGGQKLETAKRACIDIHESLTPYDLFTVVVFDSEARVVVNPHTPPMEVGDKLREIVANGTTNLSLGWYLGLLELQTHNTEDHIARLILLSDGQANQGETKVTVLASESFKAREMGITTSTIGIGDDFQEELLEPIAAESGGRFWYIEESHIEDIIREEFQGAVSVILDRPRVELQLPCGVKKTKELNALRQLAGKYLLTPIKIKHDCDFAIRLLFNPAEIQGDVAAIKATLYDGTTMIAEADKSVTLSPYAELVTSIADPIVRSVVQRYTSSVTDEKLGKSIERGEFDVMKKLIIEDINGLRQARDALEQERIPSEFHNHIPPAIYEDHHAITREWSSCARNLERRETMLFLANLFQGVRPGLTDHAKGEIEHFLARWRKMLEYGSHTKRHHEHDSRDSDLQTDFLRGAVALADTLLDEAPQETELLSVKEKVQQKLFDYEALQFITDLFLDKEALLSSEEQNYVGFFLSEEHHRLLESFHDARGTEIWREEFFTRILDVTDSLIKEHPDNDALRAIRKEVVQKTAS